MRLTKSLGLAGALILSALVGGTLIGSALAIDETDTDADPTGGEYCDVFLDTLATELGATRDDLTAAGKAAAGAAVDAAVEAGDLSEERADLLRERIDEADGDGCGWLAPGPHPFGHGFERGFERGVARGFLGGDLFEAAADALGMESSDLVGQLRDTGSLEGLAEQEGVAYDEVKTSILAAIQADLEAAVAEGLAQERADAVIERVTDWLDEGGEVGRFGRLHLGGPPHDGFGPWRGDDGEDADAEGSGT